MKVTLTAILTMVSLIATADIPRPYVEPGQVKNVDAETLNVLVYGASDAKLAALKAGSNTLVVQRQGLKPSVTRYIFTTRNCVNRGAASFCMENKQMTITKTENDRNGRLSVTYKSSEVVKLR